MDSMASQCQEHNIEALSEQLGSLQITEEALERTTEYMEKISTVPVPVNKNNEQAGLPKNMVPNPG